VLCVLLQLDKQLGSQLEDNWGLDVLVRVGETWLPKMAEATGVPRGCSLQGVAPDAATQEAVSGGFSLKLSSF
jgi:hypothetical protein